MEKLRDEMRELATELGLQEIVSCDESESKEFERLTQKGLPLPKNITKGESDGVYFECVESDMSDEEIFKLLRFREIKYLKTIKNSLRFFVVLAVISLSIGILAGLGVW